MSKPSAHEEVLWTLHKADRTAEARIGADSGPPELRIYVGSGKKETWVMSVSQVMADNKAVRTAAQDRKREFEAAGWGEPPA